MLTSAVDITRNRFVTIQTTHVYRILYINTTYLIQTPRVECVLLVKGSFFFPSSLIFHWIKIMELFFRLR